jgi:hypothetical protein
VVAGELVDEQERLALTGLFGVQLHAVVGHDRWHRVSPSLAGLGLAAVSLPGYFFYRIRAHDVLICPSGGGVGVAFGERGQDLAVLPPPMTGAEAR